MYHLITFDVCVLLKSECKIDIYVLGQLIYLSIISVRLERHIYIHGAFMIPLLSSTSSFFSFALTHSSQSLCWTVLAAWGPLYHHVLSDGVLSGRYADLSWSCLKQCLSIWSVVRSSLPHGRADLSQIERYRNYIDLPLPRDKQFICQRRHSFHWHLDCLSFPEYGTRMAWNSSYRQHLPSSSMG